MRKKITPRRNGIAAREKIMKYLKKHERVVVPSTIRDIMADCEISSTSVVDYHLSFLEREGKIKRTVRFIELVKE